MFVSPAGRGAFTEASSQRSVAEPESRPSFGAVREKVFFCGAVGQGASGFSWNVAARGRRDRRGAGASGGGVPEKARATGRRFFEGSFGTRAAHPDESDGPDFPLLRAFFGVFVAR